MQEPSLLDWLKFKFSRPRNQRFFRFGLAALAALWAGYVLVSSEDGVLAGYFWLAIAVGLATWGLAVPEAGAAVPEMPDLALAPARRAAARAPAVDLVRCLRMPGALALALLGQATLTYNPSAYVWGLMCLLLGAAAFTAIVWREGLLAASDDSPPIGARPITLRYWPLAIALIAGGYTFLAAGGNQFRTMGVLAWLAAIGAWVAAVWEWPEGVGAAAWWAQRLEEIRSLGHAEAIRLRITYGMLLLTLILLAGAYFRFAQVDSIPPEMTSDHVEKLLDVNDILNGRRPVFFERNTGREPLQFYFAVLVSKWLGTGVTHLTLKITSAVAGFVMLPVIYLIGRDLEDEALGLVAALLAGISFWATAISRVGLRFPLTPLFVALTLLFLLRGLRRGSRNDFVLAGLALGAGLYGYSTIRVLPLVVGVAIAWYALPLDRNAVRRGDPAGRPGSGMRLRDWTVSTLVLFATTFVVFLPLYRYATQEDNLFWYRTLSRLGQTEAQIPGSRWQIFFQNQWNALRMFNWKGDEVWVNTISNAPVLDFISGALFVCGVLYLLARLFLHRDRPAGLLLAAIPLLMLPSSLSLAFPEENPSAVRAAGAIPVVILVTAYPIWLLLRQQRAAWPPQTARWAGALAGVGLMGVAALVNYNLYFVRYPAQYLLFAQNASEIGAAVGGWAQSIGSYDTAYICLHPHWADTRAVGIYAGQVGWEQVLPPEGFAALAADPRPKLIVVNPRGQDCLQAIHSVFPGAQETLYHSAHSQEKDFLLFFVPGR